MRLLECSRDGKFVLTEELVGNDIPLYAILSHRWGPNIEEVTFRDLVDGTGEHKSGYEKLRFCARQARRDNLRYFWVDTCCIDKSNHTELHEAINSMFRWYQNAARCYVYLSDISASNHREDNQQSELAWEPAFRASTWFTRGWTLQELLAPKSVEFFTKEGQRLGDKRSLEQQIHEITGIAIPALREAATISDIDVEERFKWAERRQTTREEDWAYCLLGIFGVFMPLLYGEGKENAVRRLKKEIADAMNRNYAPNFSGLLMTQTLAATSVMHGEATRLGHHQDQAELLQWIGNPKDTSGPVLDAFPGTGEWFLELDAYQNWATGNGPSLLWCHGPPGVGKSVLSSVALQHLTKTLETEPVCLLYYSCDFVNRKEQKMEAIWKSLLRQVIVQGQASVLQALASSRGRLGSTRPASSRDLSDALVTVCSSQQVVLVFDGPDELESVKDIKVILSPFIKSNCRILVTSRDLPEIRSVLTMAMILEVQADRSDMRTYVIGQFEENDFEDLLESHPELGTEIIDKSNGIFLLMRILVDHLLALTTVKEMRNALQSYPTHLDQAFESSLERINAQSKSQSSLAHRVIGWIISAERKLLMSELVHGLATEKGKDTIDDENLLTPKTILKVCGGLVTANPQDGTVHMVHTTVYAWFRNRNNARFHEDIVRSCLRYLTLRPFSAGPAKAPVEMDERIKRLPFLSYAAVHWPSHVLDDAMESNLTDAINVLLDNADLRTAAFQASNYKNHLKDFTIKSAAFEAMSTGHSTLHIAAYWNLPGKISTLLAGGEILNAVDSQNWTPLHWACFGRSQRALAILVSHGAEVDAKDSVGWTPLFFAVLNGDTAMVEFLLENGANYMGRDVHGWTALRWAAAMQKTDVMSTLLRHHSNNLSAFRKSPSSSLKALSFREALRCFIKDTPSDPLDELQDEKAKLDQNARDFVDLYSVLRDESFDISQLWNSGHFDPPVGNVWRTMNKAERVNGLDSYIEGGSRLSMSSTEWKTRLLHAAIRDDKILAVRLLVELGADVNSNMTRTPLHAAAFRKNPSFAEFLLEHGAEIESIDYQGLTPLQQAVVNGFEDTVKLLLSKGAKVDAIYRNVSELRSGARSFGFHDEGFTAASKTPLMLACGLSVPLDDPTLPIRIVRLLLENGADVSIKDAERGEMTAIHYAARSRNPRILELVIDAGADSKGLDKFGRTAVHHLVLGVSNTRRAARSFDSHGNCPPGAATACMALLSQKCGIDYLSQAAKWVEKHKLSYNCWTQGMNIHTPLSLTIIFKDWELFQALHRVEACFKTDAPLSSSLDGPLLALQPAAVDILVGSGAVFPSDNTGWIGEIYILSPSHDIKSEEIKRLTAILTKLIPQGLDINAMSWHKETLLHITAFRSDSCELTQALLEIGADPCRQNGDGLDSFILAGLSHNFNILRSLLEHIKKHPTKDHWTQYLDHPETLQDSNMPAQICAAIEKAGIINSACQPSTLLCRAARSGSDDFVRALLQHGADASIGDEKGRRPLHFAALKGHTSVVEILVHWGVDLDACDSDQRTPLHLSALEGHLEVVDLLLSSGASPNKTDSQSWQPLHFAAWASHAQVAQSLLGSGASGKAATSGFTSEGDRRRPSGLYIGENWTGTPLHLASMVGNSEIVRLLLANKDADVNARTDNWKRKTGRDFGPPTPGGGPTALHIALDTGVFYGRCGSALDKGRLEIASMLIDHGASVHGVADHLTFQYLQRFEDFPELWDKLRVGISE